MPDSTNRRWYLDVWDTPGGHIDASETPAVAVQRELRAELGRTSHPGSTTQPRTCRSAHGWSRSGPENSPTLPPRSTLRSSGLGWKTFVDSTSLKAASESASCSLGLNMRPRGDVLDDLVAKVSSESRRDSESRCCRRHLGLLPAFPLRIALNPASGHSGSIDERPRASAVDVNDRSIGETRTIQDDSLSARAHPWPSQPSLTSGGSASLN
ncbi:MAG: NUDIX domain-containing protein [Actinobacteria bacterium]|nr:NUDIX domain-containing protein [Actinomycetota bacterium]